MSKAGIWSIAAIAVCTFLYLVYLAVAFEPPRGTTTVILPTPAAEIEVIEPRPVPTRITPSTPAAAASVEVEPIVVDVVEVEAPVAEAAVDLPRLNDSDSFVAEKISELSSGTSLLSYLVDEQLVRRAVVLVENISRGQYPQTALPYKPIVEEMNNNLSNFDKYDALLLKQKAVCREALPYYEKAYEYNPKSADLVRTLASLYEILEMYDKQKEMRTLLESM